MFENVVIYVAVLFREKTENKKVVKTVKNYM